MFDDIFFFWGEVFCFRKVLCGYWFVLFNVYIDVEILEVWIFVVCIYSIYIIIGK